jgi:hypothetical protein
LICGKEREGRKERGSEGEKDVGTEKRLAIENKRLKRN